MIWDSEYFGQLEQRLNQAQNNTLFLTVKEKKDMRNAKLDYELFRNDFSFSCQAIYVFSMIEKAARFSKEFNLFMEYVLVLSTFLKNRTSTKISPKNETYLVKASEILTIILTNAHDTTMPSYCSTEAFDATRIFLALSLVNIHELAGITKAIQVNRAASIFIEFDFDVCESALKSYSIKLADYRETARALTETVASSPFQKYSRVLRVEYLDHFENIRLLWAVEMEMDNHQPHVSKLSELLTESETILHKYFNERKALFVNLDDTERGLAIELERLFLLFIEEVEFMFPIDFKIQNYDSGNFEAFLNTTKVLLILTIVSNSSKAASKAIKEIPEVSSETADIVSEVSSETTEKVFDDLTLPVELSCCEESKENIEEVSCSNQLLLKQVLDRLCMFLLEDAFAQSSSLDIIKLISVLRKLKTQLFSLSLLYFSISKDGGCGHLPAGFEVVFSHLSMKDELDGIIHKIVPKAFQYNLYMTLYRPFWISFCDAVSDPKLQLALLANLGNLKATVFPYKKDFEKDRERVLRHLGWETWNLEDCCDRIETRTSVLMTESPMEMGWKMSDIWLLLEASKFISFDEENMQLYCFSAELPVFHEQIMRIFFILNRIDETVRDIGYTAYSTPEFKNIYITLYRDLHGLFMKLVTAHIRNYDIVELNCSPQNGSITSHPNGTVFISSKLKELAIQMTCPLACLDSILRLSLDYTEAPFLFNETAERFVFTCPVQSLLVLHDFVANDRVAFAEHMIEMYPCLDRHFSRFYKSKKANSGALNTALPPSYHLFVSKPPTYDAINDEPEEELANLTFEDGTSCCSKTCPAIFFVILCIFVLFMLSHSLAS